MADSTDWTLEFIDHNSNEIVIIPTVTGGELSDNYYYHLIDGTFDVSVPKAKRVWAGGGNIDRMGESLISQTYENRTITMSLNIVSTSKNYIVDGFQQLHKFANECGSYAMYPEWARGYWYIKKQWEGTENTIFSYALILAADISPLPNLYGQAGVQFYSDGKYYVPVDIELTIEPAWRSTAPFSITTLLASAHQIYIDSDTGDNYIEITGSSILGDIPPLLKLTISAPTGYLSNAYNHYLNIRSAPDVSTMGLYWTEAESMTGVNDWTLDTDSDASGGVSNNCINVGGVTSLEAIRGRWMTGNGNSHCGTFRVRARCKVESGTDVDDVGIKAQYLFTPITVTMAQWRDVGDGQYKYVSANDAWELLDLGKVHLSYPNRIWTTSDLYMQVNTKHAVSADAIMIDYVELIPVDDGAGWIRTGLVLGSNNGRSIEINQAYPGIQNVAFINNSHYTTEIEDYDVSWLTLYPGVTSRIYFNMDSGASYLKTNTVSVAVYGTFRYLTIA